VAVWQQYVSMTAAYVQLETFIRDRRFVEVITYFIAIYSNK